MFEGFLGNDKLKSELAEAVESGTLPHAVALCGKKGCGCGRLAFMLAAEYLGDRNGLVERRQHPDLMVLEGEGKSGQIPVDRIRENLVEASMASVMTSERRVVLICHAEKLNESSSNALLKSIEEPNNGIMYILTVDSPDSLLPTIRSRTAVYRVLPVDKALCAAELVKKYPSCTEKDAEKLADIFGGRLGRAMAVLGDRDVSESYRIASGFCEACMKEDKYSAMVYAAEAADDREKYRNFLEMSYEYSGWLLCEKGDPDGRADKLLKALEEASVGAGSVNLKLSSARLAMFAV